MARSLSFAGLAGMSRNPLQMVFATGWNLTGGRMANKSLLTRLTALEVSKADLSLTDALWIGVRDCGAGSRGTGGDLPAIGWRCGDHCAMRESGESDDALQHRAMVEVAGKLAPGAVPVFIAIVADDSEPL